MPRSTTSARPASGTTSHSTCLAQWAAIAIEGYADTFVAKYSKADGSFQWAKQFGGSLTDWGTSIAVDQTTNMLYVGGYFYSPTVDFNPGVPGGEVVNAGSSTTADGFLLKLDTATGGYQNVWQMGGPGSDRTRIDGLQGNEVHISGYFGQYSGQTASFPTGTLTSAGGADVFLSAFDETGGQVSISSVSQQEGNLGTTSFNFTVTRSGDTSGITTVNWNTADGTATAASGDYVAASGQVTFLPNETTKTIIVTVNGDAQFEPDETFTIQLSNPTAGTIASASGLGTILNDDTLLTKFYVANDGSPDRTYEYAASGTSVENYAIASGNTAPRGAASNAVGDKVWVVDANKNVYVYSTSGGLLGSWSAGSLPSNADVQGITTNGTDIWIVDNKGDKVYRYTGAASRLSLSQTAASSFNLNSNNTSPTDLVTDGTSIWVVNDSSSDKVFKYTVSGTLQGSWTISGAGSSPTGITINPTDVNDIWIVDSGTDKVYDFSAAASRTSGSQSPASSFALAAGNTNPQGIADPPVPSAGGLTTPRTSSSTDSAFDSALLSIVGELDGWLSGGRKRT